MTLPHYITLLALTTAWAIVQTFALQLLVNRSLNYLARRHTDPKDAP